MDFDLVIEQLCLNIKTELVATHTQRQLLAIDFPYGNTSHLDRRIRILKAMLVAATKES